MFRIKLLAEFRGLWLHRNNQTGERYLTFSQIHVSVALGQTLTFSMCTCMSQHSCAWEAMSNRRCTAAPACNTFNDVRAFYFFSTQVCQDPTCFIKPLLGTWENRRERGSLRKGKGKIMRNDMHCKILQKDHIQLKKESDLCYLW